MAPGTPPAQLGPGRAGDARGPTRPRFRARDARGPTVPAPAPNHVPVVSVVGITWPPNDKQRSMTNSRRPHRTLTTGRTATFAPVAMRRK